MANPARLGISLVALVAGGGAAALLWRAAQQDAHTRTGERAVAAESAAREIASALDRVVSVARTRARSLAEMTSVRSAIVTNEDTVADMVKRDETLKVAPDEGVWIAKLTPAGVEKLYAQGSPPKLGDPGTTLLASGTRLTAWVTMPVEPMYKESLGGRLAIRGDVDVAPQAARLRELAARAHLVGPGLDLALADAPAAQESMVRNVKLAGETGFANAQIAVQVPAVAAATPPTVFAAGGVGLVIAILALLWPRGKKAAPVRELSIEMPKGPSFGRYNMVRRLASGGMADVYLAEIKGEASFEKKIVVKHMHQHLADKPELRDWFFDEARLVAQLSHPNLVHVYELGRDDKGLPFIAMEYVEGFDLAQLSDRLRETGQKMPLRAALTITIGVCEGLHHAHMATDSSGKALNIVHRDMKPQNVLISHDGAVKVTDFGIAKASKQAHVTEVGTIAGTAAYMAPEQRAGESVDLRADLFGVGAILYECLTGREIDLDLARLVQLGLAGWPHLDPPTKVRPELPKVLDAIVFKALAFKPGDRQPDCRTLQRELEKVLVESGETASTSWLSEWLQSVGAGRKVKAG